MKKLVLSVVLVALLAAAAFGGQAIASNKPADVTVSEETSEILFDWGGSYYGSPLRMKSFEGCFDASDSPNAYVGKILEESYPEVRHVSVTISATGFDTAGNDHAGIALIDCGGFVNSIDWDTGWDLNIVHLETFEFNADNWYIYLDTTIASTAHYSYAVTVTYPR